MASAFGPRIPWVPGLPPGIATWTPDQDTWELYDLRSDFSQASDLAARNPQKVAELKKAFDETAKANRVDPVGGGLCPSCIRSTRRATRPPSSTATRTSWAFRSSPGRRRGHAAIS